MLVTFNGPEPVDVVVHTPDGPWSASVDPGAQVDVPDAVWSGTPASEGHAGYVGLSDDPAWSATKPTKGKSEAAAAAGEETP